MATWAMAQEHEEICAKPATRDRRETILWRVLAIGFVVVGIHSMALLFEWIPDELRRTQMDLHIWCGLCLTLPLIGYLIRHLARVGTSLRGRVRISGFLTALTAGALAVTGILCLWIRSGIYGQGLSLIHAWIGFLVLALFVLHRRLR